MSSASYLAKTRALIRKDLVLESRGRGTLMPMLVFAAAVVLLLAFTLPPDAELADVVNLPIGSLPAADVLAGFLWVTVLFAGLIGFARTFELDREEAVLDALLLVPLDRSGLYLAKAAGNLLFLVVLEIFVLPVFLLLFGIELATGWLAFLVVVALVDIGFVASGTLFASLAAQSSSRELILPILALPALVPLFIGGVELTSDLFLGGGLGQISERGWFGILLAYDAIFGIVGALSFEFVLD